MTPAAPPYVTKTIPANWPFAVPENELGSRTERLRKTYTKQMEELRKRMVGSQGLVWWKSECGRVLARILFEERMILPDTNMPHSIYHIRLCATCGLFVLGSVVRVAEREIDRI